MGCTPAPCAGYELTASLDFDENGDGALGPRGDPTYWNDGKGWIPIGTNSDFSAVPDFYNGIFEGNGNTISNLYIKRNIQNDLGGNDIGLFSRSQSGRFQNVGLVNPYIDITRSGTTGTNKFTNVGGLVGLLLSGSARISGSWVDGGEVSFTYEHEGGTGSDATVGCLLGRAFANSGGIRFSGATCAVNAYSTLVHTYNAATDEVTLRDDNHIKAGGLVGFLFSTGSTITAGYARGNVTCSGPGPKACGGLTGQSGGPNSNIVSSYATGNVVNEGYFKATLFYTRRQAPIETRCEQTYSNFAAGLTGKHETAAVSDSYATGRITSALVLGGATCERPYASGLIGWDAAGTQQPSAVNSYWDTETSGLTTSFRGAGRTTTQLQTPTDYTGIYANWNRNLDGQPGNDDPWDFRTNTEYPILQYGHGAQSMAMQRAPQPTATEYEPSYDERIASEEPGEYVAPPIVYNLNIRFSVKGITLDEGESATYQVRMSQSPVGHPAKVRIHSNNPDVVVSPTVLTFSSANFRQWQTVKVTTLRDPNDTDESANLAHRGPNLGYGAIIVTVNDTWPGAVMETVNGHTVTLRHTLDAPYGVTVTAPATLDADTDITIAGAPSDTPDGAPGYGLGATAEARMLADIRVQGTPADGLAICLPVSAALLTEAGDRPLTLLRYAGGSWTPVAGAEQRDGAAGTGTAMLCAAGVTEYGVFATAYTLPALGAVSVLAATAGDDAGTVTLTWTPGANAERHWVAGVKQSDRSKLAVWAPADAMGSHTVSGLDAGETYIFTVTAGRGEGDSREWSAWAPWVTLTLPAPAPTPTPTPVPTFNPPPLPISR